MVFNGAFDFWALWRSFFSSEKKKLDDDVDDDDEGAALVKAFRRAYPGVNHPGAFQEFLTSLERPRGCWCGYESCEHDCDC
jgi:hypothetical protein